MSGDQKVRFAVGAPDGPQSAVWLVFTRRGKSDVYVANRHIGGSLKVSLHQSGLWRLAYTQEYAATLKAPGTGTDDRVQEQWTRPAEQRPGWTHAMSIIVPVADLWEPEPRLDLPPGIKWRHAPAPGMESHFALMLERASGYVDRRPAGDALAVLPLPNGENLWVIAADVISTQESLRVHEQSRANLRARVAGAWDYGSRALIFGDRPDGARVIIDLHTGDLMHHSNPPH
jgi:hypothetical protein